MGAARHGPGAVVLDSDLDVLAWQGPAQHQPGPPLGRSGLNGVAQQTAEDLTHLIGIDMDAESIQWRLHLEANVALESEFVERCRHFAQEGRQIEPGEVGSCRAGKLHQVAEQTVHAPGLGDDGFEGFAHVRPGLGCKPLVLVAEQVLGLSGDNREGVVDFMAGAGGKLGQGLELGRVQAVSLTIDLVFQGQPEVIDFAFQAVQAWGGPQTAIVPGHGEEVAQERLIVGVVPLPRLPVPLLGRRAHPVAAEKIRSQRQSLDRFAATAGREQAQVMPVFLGQVHGNARDMEKDGVRSQRPSHWLRQGQEPGHGGEPVGQPQRRAQRRASDGSAVKGRHAAMASLTASGSAAQSRNQPRGASKPHIQAVSAAPSPERKAMALAR